MEKGNSVFCIYLILKEHSSKKAPLTQQKILDYLFDEYDIDLERKAVSRKLEDLRFFLEQNGGKEQVKHENDGYYLTKLFKDSEIQILLSSVVANKHIGEEQTKDLLKNLCALGQKGFTSGLRDIKVVGDWAKLQNKHYFANIELIHKAIAENKKMSYFFHTYDVIDGRLQLAHSRNERSVCTPFGIVAHADKIYLCLCSEQKDKTTGLYVPKDEISFQRLDRIDEIQILEEKGVNVRDLKGCREGIDYKAIATGMPFMYSEPHERIEMELDRYTLDQLVDSCGTEFRAKKIGENQYAVTITASPTAMTYWAVQYAKSVKVTYPQSVVDNVKKILSEALEKYS